MDVLYRPHEPSRVANSNFRPSSRSESSRNAEHYDNPYEVDIEERRRRNERKLRGRFESIFAKYGKNFEGASDEIDLVTGDVAVNNGHLRAMRHERDVGPDSRRTTSYTRHRRTERVDVTETNEEFESPHRSQSRRSRSLGHRDQRPGSSAFDEYYNNVSHDLAVEVVENAAPQRRQPGQIDQQAFFDNLHRNIMQQIKLVTQSFLTSQAGSNAIDPRLQTPEDFDGLPPNRAPASAFSVRHSTPSSTPRRGSQRPQYGTPTRSTRWDQSLWAGGNLIYESARPTSSSSGGEGEFRRRWTEEEDMSIMRMRDSGDVPMPFSQISAAMPHRSVRAVENRYFRLASVAPGGLKQRPRKLVPLYPHLDFPYRDIASFRNERPSELVEDCSHHIADELGSTTSAEPYGNDSTVPLVDDEDMATTSEKQHSYDALPNNSHESPRVETVVSQATSGSKRKRKAHAAQESEGREAMTPCRRKKASKQKVDTAQEPAGEDASNPHPKKKGPQREVDNAQAPEGGEAMNRAATKKASKRKDDTAQATEGGEATTLAPSKKGANQKVDTSQETEMAKTILTPALRKEGSKRKADTAHEPEGAETTTTTPPTRPEDSKAKVDGSQEHEGETTTTMTTTSLSRKQGSNQEADAVQAAEGLLVKRMIPNPRQQGLKRKADTSQEPEGVTVDPTPRKKQKGQIPQERRHRRSDDPLIIHLKEEEKLPWKEIAKYYIPDKTAAALSMRYYLQLKRGAEKELYHRMPYGVQEIATGIEHHLPTYTALADLKESEPDPALGPANNPALVDLGLNSAFHPTADSTPEPASDSDSDSAPYTTKIPQTREEEDELIIYLREEKKLSWCKVARHIPNKSAVTVRVRYNMHLRPDAPAPQYSRALRNSEDGRTEGGQRTSPHGDAPTAHQKEPAYISDSDETGEVDLSTQEAEEQIDGAMGPLTVEHAGNQQPSELTKETPMRKSKNAKKEHVQSPSRSRSQTPKQTHYTAANGVITLNVETSSPLPPNGTSYPTPETSTSKGKRVKPSKTQKAQDKHVLLRCEHSPRDGSARPRSKAAAASADGFQNFGSSTKAKSKTKSTNATPLHEPSKIHPQLPITPASAAASALGYSLTAKVESRGILVVSSGSIGSATGTSFKRLLANALESDKPEPKPSGADVHGDMGSEDELGF